MSLTHSQIVNTELLKAFDDEYVMSNVKLLLHVFILQRYSHRDPHQHHNPLYTELTVYYCYYQLGLATVK